MVDESASRLGLRLSSSPYDVGLMSEDRSTCYVCGGLATSREHVPPLCIFPETKDIGDLDLRRDLITVPSCDLHNLKKSRDDEFLMVSIAGIFGNNSIGFRHKLSKVDRALRRSAGKLLDRIYTRREHFIVGQLDGNRFLEVIWGTPDHERLVRCFTVIAHGIYYHEFKHRFSGNLKVVLGHLRYGDSNSAQFVSFIRGKLDQELSDKPRRGSNQSVFFYQITDKDQWGLSTIRLCFYGGIHIYVGLIPEGAKFPPNIAAEFIAGGIRTVLRVGDKDYEFN